MYTMDVLNARSLLARRDKKKTTASGLPLYPRNTHATELIEAITDSLQRFAQWVDRRVLIGCQDSFGAVTWIKGAEKNMAIWATPLARSIRPTAGEWSRSPLLTSTVRLEFTQLQVTIKEASVSNKPLEVIDRRWHSRVH